MEMEQGEAVATGPPFQGAGTGRAVKGKGALECVQSAHPIRAARVCFHYYVFPRTEYIATVTDPRAAVNN